MLTVDWSQGERDAFDGVSRRRRGGNFFFFCLKERWRREFAGWNELGRAERRGNGRLRKKKKNSFERARRALEIGKCEGIVMTDG